MLSATAAHVVERLARRHGSRHDQVPRATVADLRWCTCGRGPSHFRSRAKRACCTQAACHEEDHDLPHLRARIKDAAARKK